MITKTFDQHMKQLDDISFNIRPEPTGPALSTPHVRRITTMKTSEGNYRSRLEFHEKELSPESRTVVEKIRVLRKYTRDTGFKTTRSQNDLLQTLDGNDLANALLVLNEE
jgi:hypothetical protein